MSSEEEDDIGRLLFMETVLTEPSVRPEECVQCLESAYDILLTDWPQKPWGDGEWNNKTEHLAYLKQASWIGSSMCVQTDSKNVVRLLNRALDATLADKCGDTGLIDVIDQLLKRTAQTKLLEIVQAEIVEEERTTNELGEKKKFV